MVDSNTTLPLIRRRPRPWAPWSEWYVPSSVEELDDVLLEEYNYGKNRCAEHQENLKFLT